MSVIYFSYIICFQEDSLVSPPYRWGNWGLENLSSLIKITQVIYDSARLEFKAPSGFPQWLKTVKNSLVMQEAQVRSLGLEDSPGEENGNPFQHSYPENSMDRGAWQAIVCGVAKSRTWLSKTFTLGIRAQTPNYFILPSPSPLPLSFWSSNRGLFDSSLPSLTESTHEPQQPAARFWPFDRLIPHHPLLLTPTVSSVSPSTLCLLKAFSGFFISNPFSKLRPIIILNVCLCAPTGQQACLIYLCALHTEQGGIKSYVLNK